MSQVMKYVMFAVTATITVVVGLTIYNRIVGKMPQVGKFVSGSK